MNKKLFAIITISIISLASIVTIPVQSACPLLPPDTEKSGFNQIYYEKVKTELPKIFDSLTIGDLIGTMRTTLKNKFCKGFFKRHIDASIETGVQEMGTLGLSSQMTLSEVSSSFETGLFNRNVKYRTFLINILPYSTSISTFVPVIETEIATLIPPIDINLSNITGEENLTVELELFIKSIPFFDYITTRQFGIVEPLLTQKSTIFPTIGIRITVEGFTVFIIAFGLLIKWTKSTSSMGSF